MQAILCSVSLMACKYWEQAFQKPQTCPLKADRQYMSVVQGKYFLTKTQYLFVEYMKNVQLNESSFTKMDYLLIWV